MCGRDWSSEVCSSDLFDEAWKVSGEAGEGDVGAHWGLWDKDERFKYASSL